MLAMVITQNMGGEFDIEDRILVKSTSLLIAR